MKKSKQETAQTRQRIVATAAAEFRRNGIARTGLSEVMAAAGLTHGGFYRHFDSKDELVKEACAAAVDSVVASLGASIAERPGRAAIQAAIHDYLSTAHRENESGCCPFVTLGSELARGSDDVREAATAGFLRLVEVFASHLDDLPPAAAKKEALVMLCTIIGASTMARIVKNPDLSGAILRQARKHLAEK